MSVPLLTCTRVSVQAKWHRDSQDLRHCKKDVRCFWLQRLRFFRAVRFYRGDLWHMCSLACLLSHKIFRARWRALKDSKGASVHDSEKKNPKLFETVAIISNLVQSFIFCDFLRNCKQFCCYWKHSNQFAFSMRPIWII